jgi:hypothetical protein
LRGPMWRTSTKLTLEESKLWFDPTVGPKTIAFFWIGAKFLLREERPSLCRWLKVGMRREIDQGWSWPLMGSKIKSFIFLVLIGISNLYDLPTIMPLTRKVDYVDHWCNWWKTYCINYTKNDWKFFRQNLRSMKLLSLTKFHWLCADSWRRYI